MRKNLLIFSYMSFISIVSCEKATSDIKTITVVEMQNHLKYNNVQVVDVRPQTEFKKSHLMNAQNIIYDKDFRKKLEGLDKTRPVAIYCTSGKVSPEAAEILKEAGFNHIYLLDGGIKKWEAEEKAAEKIK